MSTASARTVTNRWNAPPARAWRGRATGRPLGWWGAASPHRSMEWEVRRPGAAPSPHFPRQLADALGRNASDVLYPLRRGVNNTGLTQQLEGWLPRDPTSRQLVVSLQRQLAPLHRCLPDRPAPQPATLAGPMPACLLRVAAVARRAGGGGISERTTGPCAHRIVQHHQLRRIGEPCWQEKGPVR